MSDDIFDKVAKNVEKIATESTPEQIAELTEDVQKLENALEASKKTVNRSVLQIEDETKRANLSESAKYDLAQKANSTFVKTEDGKVFKAAYFAMTVSKRNIQNGIDVLAKIVNDLSAKGLIHSCLAPISSLSLVRLPLQVERVVVFCFVLVPSESHEAIKSAYPKQYVEEGGIGEDLDEAFPDLPEGEFLAEIRVSSSFALLAQSEEDLYNKVQNEINLYLAILPKGTQVKSVTACGITDLSRPYEVRFYNPLLLRVKQVSLDYIRAFEMVNGKPTEFNVVTGIKYMNQKGVPIFR